MHVPHLRHKVVLALHHAVDHVVECQSSAGRIAHLRGWCRSRWVRRCLRIGTRCWCRRSRILPRRQQGSQENERQYQTKTYLHHRNLLGVDHANWNMMWTTAVESEGWPSLRAGLKRICSAARTAFSSRPCPRPRTTRTTRSFPLASKTTSRSTSPSIRLVRASSV